MTTHSFACGLFCFVLAVATVGCSSTAPPLASGASPVTRPQCAPLSRPDVDTVDGWLGYIAAHRSDVALSVDNGMDTRGLGTRVVLRSDEQQPLASAAKVVHLAAYGRAVAQRLVRADDLVRVGDWERWYLPGSDGGAHPRALNRAGVANDGIRAVDPQRTVTLDTIVSSMIQESDNAAADFLRDRLGDQALIRAAAEGGWTGAELPSFLGEMLALVAPELAPAPGAQTRAQRAAAELDLARRFATDPVLRMQLSHRPPPTTIEAQLRWADGTATGSANQLAALLRAIATGTFGAGSDVARRHLEWQPVALPSVVAVGFKGGSLPGVLTEAFTLRRADGSTATGILLVRRMPIADWLAALTSVAFQQAVLAAMTDPGSADRLSCSV